MLNRETKLALLQVFAVHKNANELVALKLALATQTGPMPMYEFADVATTLINNPACRAPTWCNFLSTERLSKLFDALGNWMRGASVSERGTLTDLRAIVKEEWRAIEAYVRPTEFGVDNGKEVDKEFAVELRKHDWYHEFSDSAVVANRGDANEASLAKVAESSAVMTRMFKEACDYRSACIEGLRPKAPKWL